MNFNISDEAQRAEIYFGMPAKSTKTSNPRCGAAFPQGNIKQS
jgi:hypothetical protein